MLDSDPVYRYAFVFTPDTLYASRHVFPGGEQVRRWVAPITPVTFNFVRSLEKYKHDKPPFPPHRALAALTFHLDALSSKGMEHYFLQDALTPFEVGLISILTTSYRQGKSVTRWPEVYEAMMSLPDNNKG